MAVPALAMTGVPSAIVMTSGSVAVAVALVALTTALKVPVAEGTPWMRPVAALTVRPGGRPVAP